MKIADVKDIERGLNDLLRGKSGCQTDGSAIGNCNLQEKSGRLVEVKDIGMIGEGRTEVEPPSSSMYSNETEEMYAEDVDQHMAILPGVVIPATGVSLEAIHVRDPGDPLSSDKEKLRQLIWANRHLLIGKVNSLPPAACGAVCDIDVGFAKPIAQRV